MWYGVGTDTRKRTTTRYPMKSPTDGQDEDGPVPFFRTWPALYASVVVCALVVMALVALFSRWPY